VVDGKALRCVGSWGMEKIYFLIQYFNIFVQGMKFKWNGKICYFEIASGPGRCIDRAQGNEFDGSALSILHAKGAANLKAARFIDIDPIVVQTLNEMINALPQKGDYKAIQGSYKDGTDLAAIIQSINPRGLNLVFIDPTDCSVPFSTIRTLREQGIKFDLIINVATKTDFNRNMKTALKNPNSAGRIKYESFLGGPELFINPKFIEAMRVERFDDGRRLFAQAYQASLTKIGFTFFASEEVHNFYEILFATGDERGLDFWQKAQAITMDGQRGLGL
jgi:three-Cys-motif partner protein